MTGSCPAQTALAKRVCLWLAVFAATLVLSGSDAHANGGAQHDFRFFPTVGTPTTTFRISFSAPIATIPADDIGYVVEAVGPRRCPNIFDFTERLYRRGDRVVFRLTPFDLYFNDRRTWCRGTYAGYVYHDGRDAVIGYFRFGVGRTPVSLEP